MEQRRSWASHTQCGKPAADEIVLVVPTLLTLPATAEV